MEGRTELCIASCAMHESQGYRVKPHGQLVLVSSRHYCPYTPSLSTSWSRTTLQGSQAPGRSHLQASSSSRTTLNGEQPYPWDRLQPQDVMSRHRGAKLPRRYELLGGISLLSPEYLLSVERWPFHTEPPDHYDLLSHLLDLSVSQSSHLMPLHYEYDFRPYLGDLRTPPLLFGRRPPQSNCLPCTVPDPVKGPRLEPQRRQAGISTLAPPTLASRLQSLPAILHRQRHSPMQSYSKGSWGLSV